MAGWHGRDVQTLKFAILAVVTPGRSCSEPTQVVSPFLDILSVAEKIVGEIDDPSGRKSRRGRRRDCGGDGWNQRVSDDR
jgi:hypothetical protein